MRRPLGETEKDMSSIAELLSQNKEEILKSWFQLVLESYPDETARFLRREKNPFANPVGQAIYEGIDGVFEHGLIKMDHEKVTPFLDRIIRIRAIQDFTPARALAFVFSLKEIIREQLKDRIRGNAVSQEDLRAIDTKVDELVLLSFNVYSACREKLFEIRVEEVKNRTFRLLQRANLVEEISAQESGIKDEPSDNQK